MATYYIDSVGGNDSNSGLTEALAWKTWAKVRGFAFVAGDTILFKAGQEINLSGSSQWVLSGSKTGTAGNPITISSYGSGTKPVLSCISDLGNTGWTETGTANVWSKSFTASSCKRVWLGEFGNCQEYMGAASAAEVNQYNRHYFASNVLYIYSVGDPSTNYSAINVCTAADILEITSVNYITISNIEFRGGRTQIVFISEICDNITITDCDFTWPNSYAIRASSVSATNGGATNLKIIRPNIDAHYDIIQQDAYNHGVYGSEDGILLGHGCVGAQVTGPGTIRGFGHNCLNIYNAYDTLYTKDNVVDGLVLDGGSSFYCRGFGIQAVSDNNRCYNNTIKNCLIKNQNVNSQLGAPSNTIENCVFISQRYNYNVDQWSPFLSLRSQSGGLAHDNKIYNCSATVNGTWGFELDGSTVVNNEFANCVVTGCGTTDGNNQVNVYASVTSENNTFSNCNFYSSATTDSVKYKGTSRSVSYMNTNFASSWQNNISGDPKFKSTTDLELKSGSPCINAGTTIEGLVTDYDGKKVPYSIAPDIGAYEYRPTVGPFRW